MTEAEPTPAIRRQARQGLTESGADAPGFPWIQLAFCLGCLAMAAWTWIRYSYRWEMTPRRLVALTTKLRNGYPEDIYVRVTGTPVRLPPRHAFSQSCLAVVDSQDPSVRVLVAPDGMVTGRLETYGWDGVGCVGRVLVRIACSDDGPVLSPSGEPTPAPIVQAGRSRFTGASVAGLVVGAMGCFIFGLYLRRWLLERRAPAPV